MCGGVGYKIKNISEKELLKYYQSEAVQLFLAEGKAKSFFWHPNAVLPIKHKTGIQLVLWGNKDKEIKLPQTGWAKTETLQAGKWDYLKPEPVDILVDSGYEKQVWFDLPEGTRGIIVRKGVQERVYMITQAASEEYLMATGHDREPLGVKRNYRKKA
jgi:hypothetical protein